MNNVIRTATVELSAIPAIAYKIKLPAGGAGIRLMRLDRHAGASYTIDKRGGDPVPFGMLEAALFPKAAVAEAVELLSGMPYAKRGSIAPTHTVLEKQPEVVEEPELPEEIEAQSMVDSAEYKAIVKKYTDERGKLSYARMNKEFIQFAARSTAVKKLVDERAAAEVILTSVIRNRAAFLSKSKDDLTDAQTNALIDTLDEIDPRSAFKELKAHINRMLAGKK